MRAFLDAPLPPSVPSKVYRKVLNMESEAREARTELSEMLDRSSAARRRAFDASKDDNAMKALREELSMQEVSCLCSSLSLAVLL